jgi:hypothetical protein
MTQRINRPPTMRPETDPPTVVDNPNDPQATEEEKRKKMERAADRAAHRAARTEQQFDEDHPMISGSN